MRIRNNKEIHKLIKTGNIVKYITAQIIKWLGHLDRMEDTKLVKTIADWNPTGIRTKRRSKNKWRGDLVNDL